MKPRFEIQHNAGDEMCTVIFHADTAMCGDVEKHPSARLPICIRHEKDLRDDINARYNDWLELAIESNGKEKPMTEEEIIKKLTETEARSKSNTRRLDRIEKDNGELNRSMNRMATAVEVLATEQKHSFEAQKATTIKIDKIGEKVSLIELAPARSATKIKEEVIKAAITLVLGAVIGAIFALILK